MQEPQLEAGHAGQAQEPKFEENGDEILFEAECDKCQVLNECLLPLGVALFVGIVTAGGGVLVALLLVIILMPIVIITFSAKILNWKLYLTKRGIHHVRPGGFCGCCATH